MVGCRRAGGLVGAGRQISCVEHPVGLLGRRRRGIAISGSDARGLRPSISSPRDTGTSSAPHGAAATSTTGSPRCRHPDQVERVRRPADRSVQCHAGEHGGSETRDSASTTSGKKGRHAATPTTTAATPCLRRPRRADVLRPTFNVGQRLPAPLRNASSAGVWRVSALRTLRSAGVSVNVNAAPARVASWTRRARGCRRCW